jgi:hypothetical protein
LLIGNMFRRRKAAAVALAQTPGPLPPVDLAQSVGRQVPGVDLLDIDGVGHFGGNQSRDGRLASPTLATDPECATGQAALAKRLDSGNNFLLSDHIGPASRPVLLVELHGCSSFV